MKKIIILFIMIIFGISLTGCNVENNDNEYSSEKLVSLKTTVNNGIESGEENVSLSNEMETLAKDISEISNIDYELYDPSYTVDDKCGTEDNKPELSKAILILENMTFEEVVELIGKPHKAFGSGAIWYEWTLENEKKLRVQFGRANYGDETLYVVKYIIK